jgi:hypothetical protein
MHVEPTSGPPSGNLSSTPDHTTSRSARLNDSSQMSCSPELSRSWNVKVPEESFKGTGCPCANSQGSVDAWQACCAGHRADGAADTAAACARLKMRRRFPLMAASLPSSVAPSLDPSQATASSVRAAAKFAHRNGLLALFSGAHSQHALVFTRCPPVAAASFGASDLRERRTCNKVEHFCCLGTLLQLNIQINDALKGTSVRRYSRHNCRFTGLKTLSESQGCLKGFGRLAETSKKRSAVFGT